MFSKQLSAQTFHTIIVSASNDHQIGIGCQQDVKNVKVLSEQIASGIGYTFKTPLVLENEDFKNDKIRLAINNLKVDTDDIIFFYYTGHGFNPNPKELRFPYLDIEKQSPNSISIDEVHSQLKLKRARFCFTLGDLCNSFAAFSATAKRSLIIKGAAVTNDVLMQLFVESVGDVKICSSRPPQISISISQGSIYTSAFIEALNKAQAYNNKISWKELFEDSKTRVHSKSAELVNQAKNEVQLYNFLQSGGQDPIAEFNIKPRQPIAELQNSEISFAEVNDFFNTIIDENLPYAEREKLANNYGKYFVSDAKVKKYINNIYVQGEFINETLKRLLTNAKNIVAINFVEKLSETDSSKAKYKLITIQELWQD